MRSKGQPCSIERTTCISLDETVLLSDEFKQRVSLVRHIKLVCWNDPFMPDGIIVTIHMF